MTARRTTSGRVLAMVASALILAGCGSQFIPQSHVEPVGKFPMSVVHASFPSSQSLSQHTQMVIKVRNDGHRDVPNVAVSVCNVTCQAPTGTQKGAGAKPIAPGAGSGPQGFDETIQQPYVANPARPVWIVDRPPGPCGYSCRQGGAGGAVTSFANTWALGPLRPGQVATFIWGVTAVHPGHHVIAYEVAAGLNGNSHAVATNGKPPQGSFDVNITSAAPGSYVNDAGQIVNNR